MVLRSHFVSYTYFPALQSWRDVVHFDDLSQSNDPAGGGILHIEAVLGNIQIHSSPVKWSNFWKLRIFLKSPFCLGSYT